MQNKKMEVQSALEKPDECIICTTKLGEDDRPLVPCGHYVHHECIVEWGKEICPICRTAIELPEELREITRENGDKHRRELEEENDYSPIQEFGVIVLDSIETFASSQMQESALNILSLVRVFIPDSNVIISNMLHGLIRPGVRQAVGRIYRNDSTLIRPDFGDEILAHDRRRPYEYICNEVLRSADLETIMEITGASREVALRVYTNENGDISRTISALTE